jgi:hypothetical protein
MFKGLRNKGDATTSTIVQESTIFTINLKLATIIVTVFLIVTIIVDNCTLIVKMVDSCTIVLVVASPLLRNGCRMDGFLYIYKSYSFYLDNPTGLGTIPIGIRSENPLENVPKFRVHNLTP